MSAIVVLPTYNEVENVGPLTTAVLAVSGVSGVVIVDDASPDGTGRVADDLARATGRVEVVHRPGKLGLGTAYRAGFARALAGGANRVLTMDADFSHPPDRIAALLAAAESHELVIGSRYVPGGRVVNWGWHRRALSRGANALARLLLGLDARDCTAGFRCYHADLLQRLDLDQVRSSDYGFLIELLYLCQRSGATIAEIPITFEDRRFGISKISQREIWRALQVVGRLCRARLSGRQPRAGFEAVPDDGPA